jgi:O-antigen/teichoic acid export membrane protein
MRLPIADALSRIGRWLRPEALESGLIRRTAKHISLTFAGQACFSVSKFVSLLLISRYLGANGFAICAVYLSSSLVLVNLCELGINITALKFLAVSDPQEWRRNAARLTAVRFAMTALVLSTVFLLSGPISTFALKHPEYTRALQLSCVAAAFSSISGFFLTLLQSRQQFGRIAGTTLLTAILQLLPVVLTIQLHWDPLPALLAGEVLSRCGAILACYETVRDVVLGFRLPGERPAFGAIAGFAKWIGLSVLIGAVQGYVPTIALARWSQPAALAIYAMGASLASGFSLLMSTTCLVLLPQALSSKTGPERLRYAVTYLRSGALVCAVMAITAWLAAPLAAPLFARDMRAASEIFRILAIASITLIALNPVQFLLYSISRPDLCAAADALILLLFAALAAWLTPSYGAEGTAWALFASQTAVKGITVWGIMRYLRQSMELPRPELEPQYSDVS